VRCKRNDNKQVSKLRQAQRTLSGSPGLLNVRSACLGGIACREVDWVV
jgi:hypothetical protein